MYSDRDVIELWRSLLPQITKQGNAIEIRLKGQIVKLGISGTATETTTKRYQQFGR